MVYRHENSVNLSGGCAAERGATEDTENTEGKPFPHRLPLSVSSVFSVALPHLFCLRFRLSVAQPYREGGEAEDESREAEERLRHSRVPGRVGIAVRPPDQHARQRAEEEDGQDALNDFEVFDFHCVRTHS